MYVTERQHVDRRQKRGAAQIKPAADSAACITDAQQERVELAECDSIPWHAQCQSLPNGRMCSAFV